VLACCATSCCLAAALAAARLRHRLRLAASHRRLAGWQQPAAPRDPAATPHHSNMQRSSEHQLLTYGTAWQAVHTKLPCLVSRNVQPDP
jgi:hypothetical protein